MDIAMVMWSIAGYVAIGIGLSGVRRLDADEDDGPFRWADFMFTIFWPFMFLCGIWFMFFVTIKRLFCAS